MDDIGNILWGLIIIGAMIYQVVSESRKARGKKTRKAFRGHDEAWPSGDPDATKPFEEMPSRPIFQPVMPAYPDEGQSLEEIPAQEYDMEFEATEPIETTSNSRPTAERLLNDSTTDAIAARSLTQATSEERASDVAEAFDLRRAVIYSEILKPRFEE